MSPVLQSKFALYEGRVGQYTSTVAAFDVSQGQGRLSYLMLLGLVVSQKASYHP